MTRSTRSRRKASAERRYRGAVVLAVLALAVIAFIVWGLPAISGADATPTPFGEPQLFPNEAAGVSSVTYVRVTNNETDVVVTLEQQEPEATPDPLTATPDPFAPTTNWVIVEAPEGSDTGLGVDSSRITSSLWSLPSVRPMRTLSSVEALAEYGLGAAPMYTIEFRTEGGGSYELRIGSKNPGETGYYAQIPGSENVYLIPASSVEQVIDFVENPPYVQPSTSEPGTGTPAPTGEPTGEAGTPEPTEPPEAEAPGPLFADAQGATVERIRVVANESDDAVAVKVGSDTSEWEVVETLEGSTGDVEADAARILSELWTLPSLVPLDVETGVDNLDDYGLDEPRYTIELSLSNGDEYEIYVGARNPARGGYYVQLDGSDDVYLVPEETIKPLLDWLTNPPYSQVNGEDNANSNDNS